MFEWDECKNTINQKKHGISFEEASCIFDYPVFTIEDDRHDYGESRYVSIGLLGEVVVITLVYTDRQGITRLISARKATPKKGDDTMSISKQRLQAIKDIKDEDIDTSDIPELDDTFWEKAELRMPEPKKGVYIRLDGDVLDWFKNQGKGYQTRINHVLRTYYESQLNSSEPSSSKS